MPAKKTIKGKRHDLGKAELVWGRWEKLGGGSRIARYGTGLNGDNRGASVIVIEVDRVSTKYRWEVFQKNDYANLLPSKFKGTISGIEKTQAAAKRLAEITVGLREATASTAKGRATPAHFYNPQTPIYSLSRTELRFDKLIRSVPKPDGWDVHISNSSTGWAAEATSTVSSSRSQSSEARTANREGPNNVQM